MAGNPISNPGLDLFDPRLRRICRWRFGFNHIQKGYARVDTTATVGEVGTMMPSIIDRAAC